VEHSDFDSMRLSVYLSGLPPEPVPAGSGAGDPAVVVCGASESRGHIFRRLADRYDWADFRGARYKNYIREAQVLVRRVDPKAVFAVFPGDCRSRLAEPVFVKSRLVADRDAPSVLLPLDHSRHWRDLAVVDDHDIPYADKTSELLWRGGTTGVFRGGGPGNPYSSRYHVASVPPRAGRDIGYSEIVQIDQTGADLPMETIRARLRPPLGIARQLRARFLLSLEGNDVATGLKWMLHSNSTVVMPHPTCESWACEGALVPYEHYVPVRDDLSDLDEVQDWCCTHLRDCEEIARNGKRFIAGFLDRRNEQDLCNRVVAAYLAVSRHEVDFLPLERLRQTAARFLRGPLAGGAGQA
jgi:hypothetical protein